MAASVLVSARDTVHAPQSSGCSRSGPSSISVSWNRTFHTVLVVVVLVDLVTTLALDRHCSATMFGVFLHCTAVLSDHMGHPQPSLSGTRVVWVSTGVLIHPGRVVDQQCVNPLAAALLLHCTELYTCVRVHKHTLLWSQKSPPLHSPRKKTLPHDFNISNNRGNRTLVGCSTVRCNIRSSLEIQVTTISPCSPILSGGRETSSSTG